MNVLLDECLPRKLKRILEPHICRTAPEVAFAGNKNGVLLGLVEASGFDVFVTMDTGIKYQQNLAGRTIAVIILRANSNRLKDVLALVPACMEMIQRIQPGMAVIVSWPLVGSRRIQKVFQTFAPGTATPCASLCPKRSCA